VVNLEWLKTYWLDLIIDRRFLNFQFLKKLCPKKKKKKLKSFDLYCA